MVPCIFKDMLLQSPYLFAKAVYDIEVDPDTESYPRVGEVAQCFFPAALVNDVVSAERFMIVLAVADLDMRDQFSSLSYQIIPPPQEISR